MSEILPLALTMMMGPQIITSILLATSKDAIRSSLGYVGGVAFAATTGTLFFLLIASLFGISKEPSGETSQTAIYIQTAFVILLIFLTLRTFVNRKKVELPKWMKSLQESTPSQAFKTALKLIYIMPTDLIVMATVGINLASRSDSGIKLVPFVALTVFIAALPILAYLLFRQRAVKAMPKVRSWMEQNSWVVSIAAYVIFLYLLWP